MFPDRASREAFQEFVGRALLGATPGRDNSRHAMLLLGPRNAGKSTLLDLLRKLVPDYAIAACRLPRGHHYYLAKLEGKCINLVPELGSTSVISGEVFKAIVGFEEVMAREPYKATVTFRSRAWHFFASNTVPRTDDRDAAFERRVLAIRLERSLSRDETDPNFLDNVSAELPGIVAWAVEGVRRAIARGHFELPPAHREVVAEMQYANDLKFRFASTRVEKAPESVAGLPNYELHAAFKQFAQRAGMETESWQPTTGMRRLAGALKAMYGACEPGERGPGLQS